LIQKEKPQKCAHNKEKKHKNVHTTKRKSTKMCTQQREKAQIDNALNFENILRYFTFF